MKPLSDSRRARLMQLMATPVRRKYLESLERMLGPAGVVSIREEQFFMLLAIAIGTLAGMAVVLFRIAIQMVRIWLLGSSLHPSPTRLLLAPALVGLVVAILAVRYFPRVRGSGVTQTKGALYIYDGHISPQTSVAKFVLSALAIGSGHSLGPEDPALQIGAGLASALGRWLKLSRERMRLVVPVGAAAGLAAAFNAPITAVLFVIEAVIGRWSASGFGAVVLSAVSGVVVERWFLGSEPLFRVPVYRMVSPMELLAYAALGIAAGALSLIFVKVVRELRPRLRALPTPLQWLQPALAGLLIGLMALRFPQILGAGYEWVDLAMRSRFTWHMLLILAAAKLLATVLSFSTSTPGGLFAPVLFMGAMLGAAMGGLGHLWFPSLTGPVGGYVLVGMGAMLAAVLRVPMTAVFMVLEVSGNYAIILPVMACHSMAYMVSRGFQKVPMIELLSRQDGLDLPSFEEESEQPELVIEDAMHAPLVRPLGGDEAVEQALAALHGSSAESVMISLGEGRWAVLSREQLSACEDSNARLRTQIRARVPRLYQDQSLDVALRFMKERPMLPVVDRGNLNHLLGVVSLDDILSAYRKAGLAEPETANGASG